MVLFDRFARLDLGRDLRFIQQFGIIEAGGLPGEDRFVHFEQVGAADHLVEGLNAELSHDLAQFSHDEIEISNDVFRPTAKAFRQEVILRRYADGAVV